MSDVTTAVTSPTVVAVDGGNSKTELVLATPDGRILARVRGAGTRAPIDGADVTARSLAELLESAWRKAGSEPSTAAVAVLNLANLDLPHEEEELAAALAPYHLADHLELGNDTLAVLQAGSPEGWGIAVVCGSGINAIAVAPDGRREGFLSLGRLSGDWGGGAAIVAAAQYHAIRHQDGRGRPTILSESLPAHFGLASPADLAVAVHRGAIDATTLLGAAPVVFAASRDGDPVARRLIRRAGRESATMVAALHRRLGLAGDAPIVLGGSILQSNDSVLLGAFHETLDELVPGAVWTVLDVAPVAGALDMALRRIGSSSDARSNARRSLDLAYAM